MGALREQENGRGGRNGAQPKKGKCDLSGTVLGKLGRYKRGWCLDLEEGDKI